jgi:hypothetical protein
MDREHHPGISLRPELTATYRTHIRLFPSISTTQRWETPPLSLPCRVELDLISETMQPRWMMLPSLLPIFSLPLCIFLFLSSSSTSPYPFFYLFQPVAVAIVNETSGDEHDRDLAWEPSACEPEARACTHNTEAATPDHRRRIDTSPTYL